MDELDHGRRGQHAGDLSNHLARVWQVEVALHAEEVIVG